MNLWGLCVSWLENDLCDGPLMKLRPLIWGLIALGSDWFPEQIGFSHVFEAVGNDVMIHR